MFEKQKMWVKDKGEKLKGFYEKNKTYIGFSAGVIASAAAMIVLAKIEEPRSGQICFNREDEANNHLIARVWYKNAFGTAKQALAIDYSDDGENDIKRVSKKLNELVENNEE